MKPIKGTGYFSKVFDALPAYAISIRARVQEMAGLLNRNTCEPPLPDMPVTFVMPMVTPDMARHPSLHECTEGCVGRWLHGEMKVVRHELGIRRTRA